MKILFIISIFNISLLSIQNAAAQINNGDPVTKYIFIDHEKSHIEILGKTNINQFKCKFEIATLKKKNTVELSSEANQQKVIGGKIQLKVDNFNCDNAQMTHDFKKLLQYKTHPFITVQVLTITNISDDEYEVKTLIQLAGEEQNYAMRLKASTHNNIIQCRGKQEICISDFSLEAPEKFFGMVKVSEDISINFHLVFEIK